MSLGPLKGDMGQLCLHGIFVFTTAILSFMRHIEVIVPLNTLYPVLDHELGDLIYKRRVAAQIGQMNNPVRFMTHCFLVAALQGHYVCMNITENNKSHLFS